MIYPMENRPLLMGLIKEPRYSNSITLSFLPKLQPHFVERD